MAAKRAPAVKPTAKPKSRSNVDILAAQRDKALQQAKPENVAEDAAFDAYAYATLPGGLGSLRVYDDSQLAQIRRVEDLPDATISRTSSLDYGLQYFGFKLAAGLWPERDRVTDDLIELVTDRARNLIRGQLLDVDGTDRPRRFDRRGSAYAMELTAAIRNLVEFASEPSGNELLVFNTDGELRLNLRTPKLTLGKWCHYPHGQQDRGGQVTATIVVDSTLRFVEPVTLATPAILAKQLDPLDLTDYLTGQLAPRLRELGYSNVAVTLALPA